MSLPALEMAVAISIVVIGVFLNGISSHPNVERHAAGEGNVGIFGGHSISIQHAPYMASLRFYKEREWKWSHVCGASIIHEQFVLTAAHCVPPGYEFKVIVGTDNVTGNGGELMDIKQTTVHPKFNSSTGDYDFCLIELEKPVTFSSKVAKVNLESDDDLPEGTKFNVTGWGFDEFRHMPQKLRQVELPLFDWSKCKQIYKRVTARLHVKYSVTPRVICAGTGQDGRDACQGDSGGPLTRGDVQVGVTSWGYGCGNLPGVFARVSTVRPWIMEKLEKHSVQ